MDNNHSHTRREESIVSAKDLSFSAGEQDILSGISFTAYPGEITVILGSSGSGKTTLLKHLLGIYPSAPESVDVLGKNPSQLRGKEEMLFYRQLGVLFQEGALLNSLTVGENVGLPLEQHTSLPREVIREIVRMKLHWVGLEEAYGKYPSQLSGGMIKRAALARALVMDPFLLFCDEPGSGLDPVTLFRLDELILDLRKMLGISVIIVTHEVSSILRIADRVVFLGNGTVLYEGPLKQAVESDQPQVRDFFTSGRGERPDQEK